MTIKDLRWIESKQFGVFALLLGTTAGLIAGGMVLGVPADVLKVVVEVMGGSTGLCACCLVGVAGYHDGKINQLIAAAPIHQAMAVARGPTAQAVMETIKSEVKTYVEGETK